MTWEIEANKINRPKRFIIQRLLANNWKQAITTSTHHMFFKRNWQCTIHRETGEVKFSRRTKTGHLMRGIEGGIE